jgi:hypothetical protein
MSDKQSYVQLSESIQHVSFLKDLPDTSEEDRSYLQKHIEDLASRHENKFDNIIEIIKKCDIYIESLEKEMEEVKNNRDAWKRNKENLVKIIKFAYQQNLINSTPTGAKYQATIRSTKPRLVDNFELWSDQDKVEYGLRKTTTLVRIRDEAILDAKQEELPDKDRVRQDILANRSSVPAIAQLIPGYSLVYERRKRLISS